MLTLASPIWLISLLPWAALTIWLLRSRHARANVPFIQFWRTDETQLATRSRARLRRPPFALACVLLSLLVGLLAAAHPQLARSNRGPITIILDRGVSMSGKSAEPALDDAARWISETFRPGRAKLIQVPGTSMETDRSAWHQQALPATGLNTAEAVRDAIREAMRSDEMPIVLISNVDLPDALRSPRMVQVSPPVPENVGIVMLGARVTPKPALMIRLRNQSGLSRAKISVYADQLSQERGIELPGRNHEQDYFFDLPHGASLIAVELDVTDEISADNRAWLVRGGSYPIIEARSSISAMLSRFIQVYSYHRPTIDLSLHVGVADNLEQISTSPGVVVVAPSADFANFPRDAQLRVVDHPVTAGVHDWNFLFDRDVRRHAPPGEGWETILSVGDVAMLAVRQKPARQVWVGFDSAAFSRSPDFVVFWTDVFDWVGQSDQVEYRQEPVSGDFAERQRDAAVSGPAPTAAPAPGVYRSDEGRQHALNAIDLHFPTTQPAAVWRDQLLEMAKRAPALNEAVDLTPLALLTSLCLLVLAAATWRSISPPESAPAAPYKELA